MALFPTDTLFLPPPTSTTVLSPSGVIPLTAPLIAPWPMATPFTALETFLEACPTDTESSASALASTPIAIALSLVALACVPTATASEPTAEASAPVELARKYLIPGFVASSPRLFVSAASVLSFDVLLLILLAFVLILVAFVLIWVALLLILPVLVFTCVLNVVRSPVVASPVVDMVIVLVAGSLVTVIWVLPFNVSPSLTVAASLPTKPPKPSIAVKTAASADLYALFPLFLLLTAISGTTT